MVAAARTIARWSRLLWPAPTEFGAAAAAAAAVAATYNGEFKLGEMDGEGEYVSEEGGYKVRLSRPGQRPPPASAAIPTAAC